MPLRSYYTLRHKIRRPRGQYVSEALLNAAADDIAVAGAWAQLHDGDPGDDGLANELGAEGRQEVTWDEADGAMVATDGALTWADPSVGGSVRWVSFWDIEAAELAVFAFALALPAPGRVVTASVDVVLPSGSLAVDLSHLLTP